VNFMKIGALKAMIYLTALRTSVSTLFTDLGEILQSKRS
jgi:Flp pilus assembly pilin Flp